MGIAAYWRLARAGFVLAREGAFSLVNAKMLPSPARFGLFTVRLVERPSVRRTGRVERLTRALKRLGPTYVKFGQTLATRPDIVGPEIAEDLSALQDRMEPFDAELVPAILEEALGRNAAALSDISEPIAAASIAQVHRAVLTHADGRREPVAVKILRPGVAARFRRDLESYYAGARLAERFIPRLRRLRLTEVVETLERSAKLELDLRFEAAAISKLAENTKEDDGFRVPEVRWEQVGVDVLTTNWMEGIPIRDNAALDAAGVDRKKLAQHLMQSFLRHAIRDGFFHADMHPGNLFADPRTGGVLAVDFGIMGRLTAAERRFLADILYGFIVRDYDRVAQRHFDIGYVPKEQSVEEFALAIRSIGEPMHGKTAESISMAKVLNQLFLITEIFDMQTRPELLLLQKNMVLVEGVCRALDPQLNIWAVSEPVVGSWLRREAGPIGRLEEIGEQLRGFGRAVALLPEVVDRADRALAIFEAEHKRPPSPWTRFMIGASFTLFVLVSLAILWRVLL